MDRTFCEQNCKGYQQTKRCFSDGICEAYKEYITKQEKNEYTEKTSLQTRIRVPFK